MNRRLLTLLTMMLALTAAFGLSARPVLAAAPVVVKTDVEAGAEMGGKEVSSELDGIEFLIVPIIGVDGSTVYLMQSYGLLQGDDSVIDHHFISIHEMVNGVWSEVGRIDFAPEIPWLDRVQVATADEDSYILAPTNFMPGGQFTLLRFDGVNLSTEYEGYGGRTMMAELHEIGPDKFGVLYLYSEGPTPPPGYFHRFHIAGQLLPGGPFTELLAVGGLEAQYVDYLESEADIYGGSLVVDFEFDACPCAFCYELRMNPVNFDGSLNGTPVIFECGRAGYRLASGAVQKFSSVWGAGSMEQVIASTDELLTCAEIVAYGPELRAGTELHLLQLAPGGHVVLMPNPEDFLVRYSGIGNSVDGFAFLIEDAQIACPEALIGG